MRGLIALLLVGLFFGTSFAKAPAQGEPPERNRTSGYWVTVTKVVDGDTIWANGVKYRLAGIDAPETRQDPRHGYKCEAERRLGELATIEAEALLLGQKIWIKPSGAWDRYDRPLVRIRYARGKWYGAHMIRMRLAAKWRGRKHKWCEALSAD